MGDMGEIFNAMKEHNKKMRIKRNEKFEPLLIELGAEMKSGSIYQIGDWFCYPTKGFAMHKKTYEKKNLMKFINEVKHGDRN